MKEREYMIDSWLFKLSEDGFTKNTIQSYRRGVKSLFEYYQDTPAGAITPRDLRDWIIELKEELKPATINSRLSAVRQFFNWYSPDSNPASNIKNIDGFNAAPKALSKAAHRKLLQSVHKNGSVRDIAIIEFMLGTGIRVSELLSLKIKDLSISERAGTVVIRSGKGGKYRIIPLPLETRNALKNFLAVHPDNNKNAALWTGQRGPLRDPSAIARILDKFSYHARLKEDVSPHVLRHTYATRYLKFNPDDIRGLAQLLGHTDIKTTMLYTKPTQEDLQSRVEVL